MSRLLRLIVVLLLSAAFGYRFDLVFGLVFGVLSLWISLCVKCHIGRLGKLDGDLIEKSACAFADLRARIKLHWIFAGVTIVSYGLVVGCHGGRLAIGQTNLVGIVTIGLLAWALGHALNFFVDKFFSVIVRFWRMVTPCIYPTPSPLMISADPPPDVRSRVIPVLLPPPRAGKATSAREANAFLLAAN